MSSDRNVPAGRRLSAASVATTAIVVFSELSVFERGEGGDLHVGRRRQTELLDQVAQPRQAGALVDAIAGGVHHDQRPDGHPGRQRRRCTPDAAFEHTRARPHPCADRADGHIGSSRRQAA